MVYKGEEIEYDGAKFNGSDVIDSDREECDGDDDTCRE